MFARFSATDIRSGHKPSTWIADYAILEVFGGIATDDIVMPYIGRASDPHTGAVLFEKPYPNWARAYGGLHTWYAAQLAGDSFDE